MNQPGSHVVYVTHWLPGFHLRAQFKHRLVYPGMRSVIIIQLQYPAER